MTLDEAIKHCKEKAKELKEEATQIARTKKPFYKYAECRECAREHEQLAEWLTELKEYKEASKGDLISRTELKKCAIPCEIHNGALTDLCVPLYQIDNAPTVEDRTREVLSLQETIRKLTQERPHGVWVVKEGPVACYTACNKCDYADYNHKRPNFCPNCGADMRGDKNGKSKCWKA